MSRHEFYMSASWMKLSNSYRKHVHNICERCGVPTWRKNDKNYKRLKDQGEDVRQGIVHHKIYLDDTNLNNPYISLSFDNLELLCIVCHNEEHFEKTPEIRYDIKFDDDGRPVSKGTPLKPY